MLSRAFVGRASLAGLEDDIIPVRAEIFQAGKELQARVKAMAQEITPFLLDHPSQTSTEALQTAEQAFLSAWNAFIADFDEWDPDEEDYFDRWGRRNEVLAFRKRFVDLQDWFAQLTGSNTSTPKYKPSELPKSSPWQTIAMYAIYTIIAGIGVYGVSQVYTAYKGTSFLRLRRNPRRRRVRRRRS